VFEGAYKGIWARWKKDISAIAIRDFTKNGLMAGYDQRWALYWVNKKNITVPGWWFGTWFLFSIIYGIILPIDELHHFSRWAHCTTNQVLITGLYYVFLSIPVTYRRVTMFVSQTSIRPLAGLRNLPGRGKSVAGGDAHPSTISTKNGSEIHLWTGMLCRKGFVFHWLLRRYFK